MCETLRPPTPERTEQFRQSGFEIDNQGRPLHPWLAQYGMDFPGQSPLWQWGPNAAADAIVFNTDKPEALLIKRTDGTWANAGGFIDPADKSNAHAAAREAWEEERIRLDPAKALPVHEGIVNDTRCSKYSWITSAAFLWRTSIKLDTLSAGDDAQGIRLMDLADIRSQQLSGSHNYLIDQAVERHGTLIEKLRYYADDGEIIPVSGGHMGYKHFINVLPTGQPVYVKQFAPNLNTNPHQAERAIMYLQKEVAVLQHLHTHGYQHTPAEAQYYDGTLAMEALDAHDNWHWRHPQESALQQQYIHGALAALEQLQHVPAMAEAGGIAPSLATFRQEGWASYDMDKKQAIVAKLQDYAATVKSDDLSDAAYKLADRLDDLYAAFQGTNYDQPTVFCHHDFRESNFAWHPQQGVKIIDWSWAGPGLKNSDATTFLIDLHKRGVGTTEHMDKFNKDHALMMIGFWLMHGVWPSSGHSNVRFQQIHSAVAAYDLLSQPC